MVRSVLAIKGQTAQIQAAAPIAGRTEGISTTVGQLTSSGQLASTDQIAADGTGSPLTGGKRGFQALDTNNRLVGTFRSNGVNVSAVPGAATNLSNNGVATAISVGSFSNQFGDGVVNYNSGSVDPGAFTGPVYVYADDPTYAGGAVSWQFSTTQGNQSAANGRILAGSITTVMGSSKTGGGSTGGSGGGRGGRQYT